MTARDAAEMAFSASARHRSRAWTIDAALTWWERLLLKWVWRTRVAKLLVARGAYLALTKQGHSVTQRCDMVDSDKTPVRPAPMFLRG